MRRTTGAADAFFQRIRCPIVRRVRRHADGLFTSELSKMKNDIAMRSYLKSLLASKPRYLRSDQAVNFLDDSEDNETRPEKACINWIYQNFPRESYFDNDSEEAAEESCKLICQTNLRLIGQHYVDQSLKEYILQGKP
ncbi:unnamed protein product [Ranitomeya imitator]|uniref:Glucagon / GIP / secretin / VIP family domain-containing protein n=1 Tax=Ranitomeya imitator TaxID=111125 RepID=A0ABN9LJM8_9NEOB|nr:unnamed protein product [Ranitomeya imitator]